MKKIIAGMTLAVVSSFAWTINGTGASFPYPVYKNTIRSFYNETGNKVNYTPTGSGTGIKEVAKRHVDFGGSDKPLTPKTLKKAKLYQFPTVVGGIVFAYNLPNIDKLKLSQQAIKGIVLGNIKYWDNPILKKDNPNLPHKQILFVHRSDKSGTTFNFTYYLSKMCKTWRHKYGARKIISWATDAQGRGIAGKGNFGVSAAIRTNPYSIGYVDYADAVKNGLKMADIEARDGKFTSPNPKSFATGAAYAGFDEKKDFYKIIAYPKKGYPIIAATFILLPKEQANTNKKVTKFFDYLYNHDEIASKLGYIPLPASVKSQVRKYWEEKGIK
jgi:phosphate transport system substrate-binding protein